MSKKRLQTNKIPLPLRPFQDLAEIWMRDTDADVERAIDGADEATLKGLVEQINSMDDSALDEWMAGPESFSDTPSEEYVAYMQLIHAQDIARIRLNGMNPDLRPS